MQQIYWIIERELCGRPGPHKVPWDPAELRSAGIRGVVSLDGPIDSDALVQASIAHLPAYQPMIVLTSEERQLEFLKQLVPIFDFIDRCRQEGGAALVHCFHGWDRSGTVIACYLIARQNLTANKAVEVVRWACPEAMSTVGYEESAFLYERMFSHSQEKS